MLKLVWLSQQACQKALWKDFDPSTQQWIVSDRKTEFFLNSSLLQTHDVISRPVRRSKEFWSSLLGGVDDDIRLLDDVGSRVQARDFLLDEGVAEWCRRPHAPDRLIEGCLQLASLVTHEGAREILDAFESKFGADTNPFVEVARLGGRFYQRCIEAKRLPRFFLPFYLQSHPHLISGANIIFDLGFEMRDGEKELIQRLAQDNEITVLIPAFGPEGLEDVGLQTYGNFDVGVAKVKMLKIPPVSTEKPAVKIWRCSSPEAEARKAVELVALWVSQGIAPDRICVAAPRISVYENALAHDLEWEGLGLQRTLKTRLSASRLFRALSARLKIISGALGAPIMEEAFLTTSSYRHLSQRRRERRVLKPVLRENQVPETHLRDQIVGLKKKYSPSRLTANQFENLVIELFSDLASEATYENPVESEQRNNLFLTALANLRRELGPTELPLALWIESWQEVTSEIPMNFKQAAERGVWAVDLSSAEEAPAEHLIILGAVESRTPPSLAAGLGEERLRFLKDLGFDFSATVKKSDPQMAWLMTGARTEIVVSCPKTDSGGKSVAASPLWLRLANQTEKDLEKLDFTRHSRWTDIQRTILTTPTSLQVDAFKRWPRGTTEDIGRWVDEEIKGSRTIELGEQAARPLAFPLSATRIESYWECPFKFFARSYLYLYDEEDLEIEPSPQARGLWMHSAVELLLASSLKTGKELTAWTDDELGLLIDGLPQVEKQKRVSSDIWPSIRSRFVRQLKRFLNFEMEWRKRFPRASPQGFEAVIKGWLSWTPNEAKIHFKSEDVKSVEPQNTDEEFWSSFRGNIDRVDYTSTGKAIIVDYKASTSNLTNIPSWQKMGKFQLALYAEALEGGLFNQDKRKVIAAQYYALRNPEREKGFKLIDEDLHGILPQEGAAKAAVDTPTRDKYFAAINKETHGILENIRLGHMTPKPHDPKHCDTCAWRNSCRAPHLS